MFDVRGFSSLVLALIALNLLADYKADINSLFKPTASDYRDRIIPFNGDPKICFHYFQLTDGLARGEALGKKRVAERYVPCGQIVIKGLIQDVELKSFMRRLNFELVDAICLDGGLLPEKKGVRVIEASSASAASSETLEADEMGLRYSAATAASMSSVRIIENVEGLSRKFQFIYVFYCQGKRPKAKLGVCMVPVDEATARQIGTRKAVGVTDVVPDSVAWEADIFNGDVLLELGGRKLSDPVQANRIIKESSGKQTLKIWRNGKVIQKSVTFAESASDEKEEHQKPKKTVTRQLDDDKYDW